MELTLLAISKLQVIGTIISIVVVLMILAAIRAKRVFSLRKLTESDIAGVEGEKLASDMIKAVLNDGDRFFSNLVVNYNGKRAELDNVIVNCNGIFIIEVKNYSGRLVGNADDYEWSKFHESAAGITYEKIVKNPIKQVKRQVYVLAGYLREAGINVWINGCALLLQKNSPVDDPCVLQSADDIDRAIHTHGRTHFDDRTISDICRCLENVPEYVI